MPVKQPVPVPVVHTVPVKVPVKVPVPVAIPSKKKGRLKTVEITEAFLHTNSAIIDKCVCSNVYGEFFAENDYFYFTFCSMSNDVFFKD